MPSKMPDSVPASATELLLPIVILLIVYAALLALAYKYAANTAYARAFFKASTPGAILTVINSGGVYLIVLAASAQYSANAQQFAFNVAAATLGLALGWVLGIIISPSTKDEQSEFSLLTKAVSTFLTGYVLGYVKDIKLDQVQHFIFDRPGVPFRLFIGTACCFSTLAVVFVSRRAEIMKANAVKDWFIRYSPCDPRHAKGLPIDLLATGPFASKDDALAQIELIKGRDEFKGLTLSAVRVEIGTEEPPPTPPPPSQTTEDTGVGTGNEEQPPRNAPRSNNAGSGATGAGTTGAAGAAGGATGGDQTTGNTAAGNTTTGNTTSSANGATGSATQSGTGEGWTGSGSNDGATTDTTEQSGTEANR